MKTFLTALFSGIFLFYPALSWAFPENVRHGYVNCSSCHVNPNGQGLLNDYGRALSKAIQSNGKFFFEPWVKTTEAQPAAQAASAASPSKAQDEQDNETQFLYGYFPRPQWLNLGGDLRFLQLFQNTPTVSSGQFIVMQMDLEAAVTVGKFTLDATLGRIDPSYIGNINPGFSDYILSRRHFLVFQATDEIFLMGGRFWKPYGILDANHSSTVKEYLGWNFGSESYNLEAGYTGGSLSLLGYVSFGRPDNTYYQIEKGEGATASIGFSNSYKAGLSFFHGYTDAYSRNVFGPWGLLGFNDHFYLNTENDFVLNTPTGADTSTTGFATYNRLGYEWVQGFHTYLEHGFNQLDLTQASTQIQIYGVGMLYYPRAHWEFEADIQKRKYGVEPNTQGFTDYLYFQMHYYL